MQRIRNVQHRVVHKFHHCLIGRAAMISITDATGLDQSHLPVKVASGCLNGLMCDVEVVLEEKPAAVWLVGCDNLERALRK